MNCLKTNIKRRACVSGRIGSAVVRLLTLAVMIVMIGCGGENYTPKPKGYMRIDMPEQHYERVSALNDTTVNKMVELPFSFEANKAAELTLKKNAKRLTWVDIKYPEYGGYVFLTYIPLKDVKDLAGEVDTSYRLLSKHFDYASGVDERQFVDVENHVYATTYRLQGRNVASTYQFWATDSVKNFLRGSIYIDCVPNNDSLAPVVEYLQKDIDRLIESLKWQ